MTKLSIVIPVQGNVSELERTLVSVLANRPDDCEVLAVLNTDYDDPYDLSEEVRFLAAPPRAKFVQCANLGIRHCRSPIVHILGAGFEVQEGWADIALEGFENPQLAAVAPVVLSADDSDRVLSAGVTYRSGGIRLSRSLRSAGRLPKPGKKSRLFGPHAAAAFYRVEALDAVGGGLPNTNGNDFADVQLAMELRDAGYSTIFDPRVKIVADELPSWDGHGFRYGLHAERMFWRHAFSQGMVRSLLLHPFTVLAELLGSLPSPAAVTQLLGRMVGCLPSGFYQQPTHQAEKTPAIAPATANVPDGMRIDSAHGKREPAKTGKKSSARVERRAA